MPEPFEPAANFASQDVFESIFSDNRCLMEIMGDDKVIEGVAIKSSWMQFPDFPEPPDNIRTQDNAHQWEQYSLRIKQFHDKYSTIK